MKVWIAALLLATFSRGAFAFELKQTKDGKPVRWPEGRRRLAVLVDPAIEDGRRAMVIAALRGATRAWSETKQVSMKLDADGDPSDGPSVVITWPKDQWPYDHRELMVTAVELDPKSGAILSATTRINDEYPWSTLEGAHADDAAQDLQSTLTHELGHAIGLAHSTVEEATMHPGSAMRETDKRTLARDDHDALLALYGSEPASENVVDDPAVPYGCTTAPSAGDATIPLLLMFGLALLRAKMELSRRRSSSRRDPPAPASTARDDRLEG